MLSVIVIVGRANVGKSTLFNFLTKSRVALVADLPGVTRDRQYGEALFNDRRVLVVDTGGVADADDDDLSTLTIAQVDTALQEADIILFVVDAKLGLVPADEVFAEKLRRQKKPVFIVINKADDPGRDAMRADFYSLGFGEPWPIAAKRGRGVKSLIEAILKKLPEAAPISEAAITGIKMAVIGRPNVGKSTLVNRLLGEERVIVSDRPGTTRDTIFIPFEHHGQRYTLIDTAGIRRRSKIHETIEKFSIIKSMQAMDQADVVIFVVDGTEGVTEQDARLLHLIIEAGTPLLIAVNKWDGLSEYDRDQVRSSMDRRLAFLDFVRCYFISAIHGTGVGDLYRAIDESYAASKRELPTPALTRVLEKAVEEHNPPMVSGRRVRLRYAHLGERRPLTIIVHGKQTQDLPLSYSRYLANCFRKAFKLIGVPIHIKLKTDYNPYDKK